MLFCSALFLGFLLNTSTSFSLDTENDLASTSAVTMTGGVDEKVRASMTCLGKYILEYRDLPEWGDYQQPIYAILDFSVTESRFELTVMYNEITRWKGRAGSQCGGSFGFDYPMIEPPVEEALQDYQSKYLRNFIRMITGIHATSNQDVYEISYVDSENSVRFWYITPLDVNSRFDTIYDVSEEEGDLVGEETGSMYIDGGDDDLESTAAELGEGQY